MGSGASQHQARSLVIHDLAKKTSFEKDEVRALHKKFRELAKVEGNPFTITPAQFEEALKLVGINESDAKLLDEIFKQMDLTDSGVVTGQVNFSQFCVVCSYAEKTKFSFELYDTDETGKLSKENLAEILNAVNSGASCAAGVALALTLYFGDQMLSAEEVTTLVDEIFKAHDADGSGFLEYGEYVEAIVAQPILVGFISGTGKGLKKAPSITYLVDPAPAPAEAPAEDAAAAPAPAP